VIGRKVSEVIPEPSLSMVLGKYRQPSGKRHRLLGGDFRLSHRAAGRDVCIAPVFDEAGNCTHLVGSVHDITERKRTEEKLEEEGSSYGH